MCGHGAGGIVLATARLPIVRAFAEMLANDGHNSLQRRSRPQRLQLRKIRVLGPIAQSFTDSFDEGCRAKQEARNRFGERRLRRLCNAGRQETGISPARACRIPAEFAQHAIVCTKMGSGRR